MVAMQQEFLKEIQPADTEVVRLAQVTDSHIFADPEGCLLGLNTRLSFEAVCSRLQAEEWRPDGILATGDLSQDASIESYQYLADYFDQLKIATFWLPGNHDVPAVMQEHLNSQQVFTANQVFMGSWQIIMLDSSVAGKVHGELAEQQLDFLQQCLQSEKAKHTLICLHHQPQAIGCEWLDQIGLKNAETFNQIIKKYPSVKGVLWGHVHQEYQQNIDGIEWFASPSSCVQFKPGSQDFSAGSEAPGYRMLNLFSDGRIESVVHRIDNLAFTVDYSIKGY